jgi:hypothetical protein
MRRCSSVLSASFTDSLTDTGIEIGKGSLSSVADEIPWNIVIGMAIAAAVMFISAAMKQKK